ncbi:acetyltransferase [Coniella lustricola]|uniref:Acetyltransferase n=1 Tax=Coniella lustricola TaxID=2025994 RepID=A0A2T3A5F5_9PEZI|nr:acetyltransferase [Coniella lustricola]
MQLPASAPPTFCLPLKTPIFNERVKLIPFDVDLHSAAFVSQTKDRPDLFAHLPKGPWASLAEWKAMWAEPDFTFSPSNPSSFLFAIIDTTRPPSAEDDEGEFAGVVAYMNTSQLSRSTEIGFIVVLPAYQRTHVALNTTGLLLQYAFDDDTGLALARVGWWTSSKNVASARLAEKIGFSKVGEIPYHMAFPLGRMNGKVGNGKPLPPRSDPDDVWRDSLLFSVSWDQWKAGSRKMMEVLMAL